MAGEEAGVTGIQAPSCCGTSRRWLLSTNCTLSVPETEPPDCYQYRDRRTADCFECKVLQDVMAHYPPASSLEHFAPILVMGIFVYNSQMRLEILANLISPARIDVHF